MKSFCLSVFLLFASFAFAQDKEIFTHADTLRGSLNPNRTWWDVLHYDIAVTPDFETKTISGSNLITYKVVERSSPANMQIDLQQPMEVDSILSGKHQRLTFQQDDNVCLVKIPKQVYGSTDSILVFYHGKPREAVRPPWDGGWIWKTDSLGRGCR